jgi:hypothetical protein
VAVKSIIAGESATAADIFSWVLERLGRLGELGTLESRGIDLRNGQSVLRNAPFFWAVKCFNFFLNLTIFHVRKRGGGG